MTEARLSAIALHLGAGKPIMATQGRNWTSNARLLRNTRGKNNAEKSQLNCDAYGISKTFENISPSDSNVKSRLLLTLF